MMLRRWSWDASASSARRLRSLADNVDDRVPTLAGVEDGDRIRGIEGDAARSYFKGLGIHLADRTSQIHFPARSRRPPRDPANAALGFTYGLLLGEVQGALQAVGLDPQIGFLHGLRPGRASLALDLLEELRPAVADRLVVRLFTRRQLSPDDFAMAPGGACYFTDEGRRRFFEHYDADRDRQVPHRLLGRDVSRAGLPLVQATLLARHIRGDLPEYAPFLAT
jgi:CRISPR-associated protein Cas1